jgi:hypothetical protein
MRGVVSSVIVGLALVGSTASTALAATGSAIGAAPDAAPGKKVCTIKDSRLVGLSGMVATKSGYVVINDGTDVENRKRVFYLTPNCSVDRQVAYSGKGPRDPEDMGVSPDGKTLYIADIGDNATNSERRTTIALWTMPVSGSQKPVINRLVYPDGPHDAEALLFNGDGTPIIVTKEVAGGKAAFYTPTGPLQRDNPQGVPLQKVGEVALPKTTTPNPLEATGRIPITGGANAPDGSRVVLRTYADAFEWDVKNGNVVEAITKGEPRVTPLPEEPWGEAISYTADGSAFVTVSDVEELSGVQPTILRYTPGTAAAPPIAAAADPKQADTRSWFDKLSIDDITYMIGAVGLLGVLLVGVGVFGIMRARRRPPADGASAGLDGDGPDGDGPPPDNTATTFLTPIRDDPDYGYQGEGWDQPAHPGYAGGYPGDEYGPSGHEYRPGGVYSGHEYSGQQYGGHEYSGQQYSGQQYGGHEYSGQQYGGHEYSGQEYGGNYPTDGREYSGQGYDGYAYGGYGEPDPRRY